MSDDIPFKQFVARYLARGAVGVSVGLAAVAPAVAKQPDAGSPGPASAKAFAGRLSAIRAAVSAHIDDTTKTAQIVPHPFANAPPFKNFFAKEPFKDTWKNR
jgi:hypothetical protein